MRRPASKRICSTATGTGAACDARIVVLRHAVAAGDPVTLTVSATATSPKAATALIYRGVSPTAVVDALATGTASAASRLTTASLTTSMGGDHLVALVGANASPPATWAPPTSPSAMSPLASAAAAGIAAASDDAVVIKAGTAPGLSVTTTASGNLAGVLLALTPALTTYSYDTQGNQIRAVAQGGSGVTTTMGYDAANRLVSFASQSATATASASYTYFGDGTRASKTTAAGTTTFTWDQVDATLLSDGATTYVYGLGGVVLEQV